MKTYELTYIISSRLTSEEAGVVAKDVENLVQSKEGVIVKSEKISAQTLAYPIKKQSSGYYVILECQMAEEVIKWLKAELEKNPKILRNFVIVKHPIKIMKKRRTKKPVMEVVKEVLNKIVHPEKEAKKVNPEDLDKKLDEILA